MSKTRSVYAVLQSQGGVLYLLKFSSRAAFRLAGKELHDKFPVCVTSNGVPSMARIRREEANVIFKQRTREPDVTAPGPADHFDCLWVRP